MDGQRDTSDQEIPRYALTSPNDKRLVLLRDVPVIMGYLKGEHELPVTLGPFPAPDWLGGDVLFCSLVKVTPHTAFYREPIVPNGGRLNQTFDPRQT
jgi:hypothetical protein